MADEYNERKPTRPQSTAARTFSADLHNAFNIDREHKIAGGVGQMDQHDSEGNLGHLSQTVEEKKQALSSQSQELEALEQRIRATEERLKQRQRTPEPPSSSAGGSSVDRAPPDTAALPRPIGTSVREAPSQQRDQASSSESFPQTTAQDAASKPSGSYQRYQQGSSVQQEQAGQPIAPQPAAPDAAFSARVGRFELPRQDSESAPRMPGAFVKTPGDMMGRDYVESRRQ